MKNFSPSLPRDCIAWGNGNCNLVMPHDAIVRQRGAGVGADPRRVWSFEITSFVM